MAKAGERHAMKHEGSDECRQQLVLDFKLYFVLL